MENSYLIKTSLRIWLGHNGDACLWNDNIANKLFAKSDANSDSGDETSSMIKYQRNGNKQATELKYSKDTNIYQPVYHS